MSVLQIWLASSDGAVVVELMVILLLLKQKPRRRRQRYGDLSSRLLSHWLAKRPLPCMFPDEDAIRASLAADVDKLCRQTWEVQAR